MGRVAGSLNCSLDVHIFGREVPCARKVAVGGIFTAWMAAIRHLVENIDLYHDISWVIWVEFMTLHPG